jgi:hypothetical protein
VLLVDFLDRLPNICSGERLPFGLLVLHEVDWVLSNGVSLQFGVSVYRNKENLRKDAQPVGAAANRNPKNSIFPIWLFTLPSYFA